MVGAPKQKCIKNLVNLYLVNEGRQEVLVRRHHPHSALLLLLPASDPLVTVARFVFHQALRGGYYSSYYSDPYPGLWGQDPTCFPVFMING